MADENVIPVDHPIKAAWKVVWGVQAEALSLSTLWQHDPDPDAWACLADSVFVRMDAAVDALEHAYRQSGMSPLTYYDEGGMGAVAPMVAKVVGS